MVAEGVLLEKYVHALVMKMGGLVKTMTWSNGRKDLAFFHFCIGWLTARFLVRSCDLQVVRLADPPRQLIGPTFICSLPFIFSNRKLKN